MMFFLRKQWLYILLIILTAALAACGGDEEKPQDGNSPAPDASPWPAEWTPEPGEGPGPVPPGVASRPDPTNTPYSPPPDTVYQSASELARSDLSTRLQIAPDQIAVLEPDSTLFLDDPVDCPTLPDETLDSYYVYLQVKQNIYPYQAYEDPAAGPVVEACADVMIDEGELVVPTPGSRESVVEQIRADLEARGVDSARGEFRVMRPVTWTDQALGCRVDSEETPAPALIKGYLVVYVVGGVSYEYHADETGERIEFCEPPEGFDTIEALVAALQENEDLEVAVVEGEKAAYAGLDKEGTLIQITADAYRVGLFEFNSKLDARRAAQRVDDPGVSHILVSGNVLVVQEENSPAVYSTLLNYAEEIRSPLLEEDSIPSDEEAPPDDETPAEGPAPVEGPAATLPPTPEG